MATARAKMVAAGLETGSVKFLTVATQTSAGGTNATSARNPSPKLPAIPQVRDLYCWEVIILLYLNYRWRFGPWRWGQRRAHLCF